MFGKIFGDKWGIILKNFFNIPSTLFERRERNKSLTSPLLVTLSNKLRNSLMKLWGELFLRIDMHQKEKKESGKYLENNWIRAKEKILMK